VVQQHQRAMRLAYFVLGDASLIERENKRCLALRHLGLKTALVKGLSESANAAAGATEGDEAGSAEEGCDSDAASDCEHGGHGGGGGVGAMGCDDEVGDVEGWECAIATFFEIGATACSVSGRRMTGASDPNPGG
jgi:hypothetical protein